MDYHYNVSIFYAMFVITSFIWVYYMVTEGNDETD